jgi:chemotaxis family two-component system response regulator Rcp1
MIEKPGERKVQILLVEDNPADVDLVRRALRSAELNFELAVIEDGAEALAFVRQKEKEAGAPTPDLVVLDMNLPKNSGLEILEAMRTNRVFAGVPVAILTSSSSPRERTKMEGLRVGRYITKPPDLEEFLRIGLIIKALLVESGFHVQ